MNNSTFPTQNEHAGENPALVGFVVGAAVGAGIALLFAPATGTETRRSIGRVATRIRHRLDDTLHHAQTQLGEFRDDVGSALDSGRKAFNESRESRASG